MKVLRGGVDPYLVEVVDVFGPDVVLIAEAADKLHHVGAGFCDYLMNYNFTIGIYG